METAPEKAPDDGSGDALAIVQSLAEKRIWVAPVGVEHLRGFMVCRRTWNNVDGPNTRVDFLLANPKPGQRWKKPFREAECLFPSLRAAIDAAVRAMNFPLA
jgi:hypothetical protein